MKTKHHGAALALAAAGLIGCGSMSTTVADDGTVHCYGVNKCKGFNGCKTANNACKGHASCKGQGFVSMSKHACDALGGEVGE